MVRQIIIPLFVSIALVSIIFIYFENSEQGLTRLLQEFRNESGSYIILSFSVLASDVVLPVPSSVVMYLNGAVLGGAAGAALSLVSLMLASLIGYGLGRAAAGKRLHMSHTRADSIIHKYGMAVIVLSRGIPILAESICFVAGYNRLNLLNYLLLNLIGYIPLCLVYALLGSFSQNGSFLYAFGAVLAFTGCLWLICRRFLHHIDLYQT